MTEKLLAQSQMNKLKPNKKQHSMQLRLPKWVSKTITKALSKNK